MSYKRTAEIIGPNYCVEIGWGNEHTAVWNTCFICGIYKKIRKLPCIVWLTTNLDEIKGNYIKDAVELIPKKFRTLIIFQRTLGPADHNVCWECYSKNFPDQGIASDKMKSYSKESASDDENIYPYGEM